MRHGVFAALAAAVLIIPGAAVAGQANGLTIEHAWMRTLIPSRPAAGYFVLRNDGDAARRLVGARSPDCGTLMLHRSVNESGQERMEMVKQAEVPAHGTLRFAPGGYHMMCMKPSAAMKPGGHVPVTLRFADGASLTASFAVKGAAGE